MRGLCLWMLLGATAQAQAPGPPQRVRFSYERGPGAERCPDEGSVRNAVSARLGYEPFDPNADKDVRLSISGAEPGLFAALLVTDRAGSPVGKRELRSRSRDCAELAAALQLALAIAIDPQAFVPKPAPAAAPPAPAAPAPAPAPPAPPPLIPIRVHAGAGALGAIGAGPSPTAGLWAGVGLHRGRAGLHLEGRVDAPQSLPVATGSVATEFLLASLSPCFELKPWEMCLVGSGGALRVAGKGLAVSRTASSPLALVGARAAVEWPLNRALSLEASLESQAILNRTTVLVNDGAVWVTPPLEVSLAVGLLVGGQ